MVLYLSIHSVSHPTLTCTTSTLQNVCKPHAVTVWMSDCQHTTFVQSESEELLDEDEEEEEWPFLYKPFNPFLAAFYA